MEASVNKACSLCREDLEPLLAESSGWRLILNRNQNLLGKCFLVLRRHLEVVSLVTPSEWADLHRQMARATEMLNGAFQPEHFNYAFLQNQDRHVHFHIIPRYAGSRIFEGEQFDDPDYPHHYAVPSPVRRLDPVHEAALAERLRSRW